MICLKSRTNLKTKNCYDVKKILNLHPIKTDPPKTLSSPRLHYVYTTDLL